MDDQTPADEWEISKENVVPLRQGRSIQSLNSALHLGTPQRNQGLESKKQEQEQAIDDYVGNDPIRPWQSYIRWMQENCPTDTRACMEIMERCLQRFADSPLYIQDLRFLHIWCNYINSLDYINAKQSFAYMRSRGIGSTHALFFLAETIIYEQHGDYEQTERVYQEAITKVVTPVDMIKKNQYQFHRRMRRKCINLCKEQREQNKQLDNILVTVEANGITMQALRRLSELHSIGSSIAGSNRNFGVLQEIHRDADVVIYSQSQGLEMTMKPSNGINTKKPFVVCVDNKKEEKIAMEVPWKRLESMTEQRKENEVVSERWRDVRLTQQPHSIIKQSVPFTIYTEISSSLTNPFSVSTRSIQQESKQLFGFNRLLFLKNESLTDQISFEEYRAQFYPIQLNRFQTPKHCCHDDDEMDCESSDIDIDIDTNVICDPVRRKLDFGSITPMAKEFKSLSLMEKDISEDLTMNTKGVLNEMSEIFGSTDWSSKHEKRPVFDIMSTVKKSQKRQLEDNKASTPFSVYQPVVVDSDVDYDKENMPVSYEHCFSKNIHTDTPSVKRRATDTYRSVVADIDLEEEGSITRQDSKYIQQLISSQTHSRKSSTSGTNRISDQDESHSFLTGRRDTADMRLLLGLQELIDKANDNE